MNVSHPEFNFFGFLVPLSLVSGVLGFLIAWLTVAVLERLRLTGSPGTLRKRSSGTSLRVTEQQSRSWGMKINRLGEQFAVWAGAST